PVAVRPVQAGRDGAAVRAARATGDGIEARVDVVAGELGDRPVGPPEHGEVLEDAAVLLDGPPLEVAEARGLPGGEDVCDGAGGLRIELAFEQGELRLDVTKKASSVTQNVGRPVLTNVLPDVGPVFSFELVAGAPDTTR